MRGRSATDEPWYAVRCLFEHTKDLACRMGARCYEERVVILRARTFGEALRKGEAEAKRYARGPAKYLGFIEVYHLYEDKLAEGAEVFSVMRSKRMTPARFVRAYYDDGSFHRSVWSASRPKRRDARVGFVGSGRDRQGKRDVARRHDRYLYRGP